MSNHERQRQFRARNPGYFKRYHARRKAAWAEAKAALAAAAMAETPALPAPVEVSVPAKPVPLALPAPVIIPIIPGMNAIRTKSTAMSVERVPLPLSAGEPLTS